MRYKLRIRKSAKKYLDKNATLKKRVKEWLQTALDAPYNHHDGKLTNYADEGLDVYKKRFSDFRVLFTIHDETVYFTIIKIAARGQAYK
jgi:mRNA-degrading endonuclease RelE of RelBE toxin-antitoxin system